VCIGTVNTFKSVVGFAGQVQLIALGIGLTVAVCEASAVEFAKRTKGFVRLGFIVLFTASMFYIITNTLFVYYSAYNVQKIEREARNAEAISDNSVEMRRYNSEVEKYNIQKKTIEGEIELIDQTITGIPADYITRRNELFARRELRMNELNALVVPVEPETTSMTTEHTAWELLARVFGIDADLLSMIFLVLPAVIADIASPLFFCMFFGQKEEIHIEPPVKRKKLEEQPDSKDVIGYIENALQNDNTLLPDEEVGNMGAEQCKKMREYLKTFVYKGVPVITEKDGRYVSFFDKKNLKLFIQLQYKVQRTRKATEE
jgi:hypothetical protein